MEINPEQIKYFYREWTKINSIDPIDPDNLFNPICKKAKLLFFILLSSQVYIFLKS